MTRSRTVRPAGSYGVDAPWVPWLWIGLAVLYAVLAVLSGTIWAAPAWSTALVGVVAVLFLVCGLLFWYASYLGKFVVWREVLRTVPEPARVLDLGCGHGAVAIMTAQRFPSVHVTGIDLWRSVDQSGNSLEAAQANAAANDVADRVDFLTGDMTALPRFDEGFDLITASLSIHNIRARSGRDTALDEAWQVLTPGGTLVIVDISKARQYAAHLATLGAVDVRMRGLGWRMWWSGPWMPTRLLTARKPGASLDG